MGYITKEVSAMAFSNLSLANAKKRHFDFSCFFVLVWGNGLRK